MSLPQWGYLGQSLLFRLNEIGLTVGLAVVLAGGSSSFDTLDLSWRYTLMLMGITRLPREIATTHREAEVRYM